MSDDNSLEEWRCIPSEPPVFIELCSGLLPNFCNNFSVSDVLSFDDWALSEEMIKRPVHAIVVVCDTHLLRSLNERCPSQFIIRGGGSKEVFFTKQIGKDSCGTIAVIHSLVNMLIEGCMEKEGLMQELISDTMNLSPEERGNWIERNDKIRNIHNKLSAEPIQDLVTENENGDFHYCTLIQRGSSVILLDGRNESPMEFPIDFSFNAQIESHGKDKEKDKSTGGVDTDMSNHGDFLSMGMSFIHRNVLNGNMNNNISIMAIHSLGD